MIKTGKDGGFKVGTNVVANLNDWKLDIDTDMKDTTAFKDQWKSQNPQLKSWTGTVSGDWNVADDANGQKVLQDAQLGGTSVSAVFDIDGTHNYSGTAFIKKISVGAKVDDNISFSAEFQGSGPLTYA